VPLQLSWIRTRRSCGFDSAPAREGSHQWEGEENLANEVHIHLTIDWPTAIALEHLVVRTMLAHITMRLSDARLRRRETKVRYPNHRLPPRLTEDATPVIARLLAGFAQFLAKHAAQSFLKRLVQAPDVLM
jgi:hypothetical protein